MSSPSSPHILVVGAGIVGASLAWHLTQRGARVTVLDASEPGGVATRASWAWINASWGNPLPYFRLRRRAMEEWRRVERELPTVRVAWCGGLLWDLTPGQLATFAGEHAAWGYPLETVDRAEAARLEPALADPPAVAVHATAEGAVEPLETALAFLDAVRASGATVIADRAVRALDVRAGRVVGVETDDGAIAADEVVVAAGVASPALLSTAGVTLPLREAPGIVVWSEPRAPLLNRLLILPGMELRQLPDGRLLAAADIDADAARGDGVTRAKEVFAEVQGLLKNGDALRYGGHTVAWRPMPRDGFPFVGRAPGVANLSVAVTHSGVTLAPAIGAFLADEILTGNREPLLAPYGLERIPA